MEKTCESSFGLKFYASELSSSSSGRLTHSATSAVTHSVTGAALTGQSDDLQMNAAAAVDVFTFALIIIWVCLSVCPLFVTVSALFLSDVPQRGPPRFLTEGHRSTTKLGLACVYYV